MLKKLKTKYRTGGLHGLQNAVRRRLLLLKQPTNDPVKVALEEILRGNDFTIVQIGAYVGNTVNDPLFLTLSSRMQEGRGRLICVEPVQMYFARLIENHRGIPGVFFENVAISDQPGPATFYRLGVDPAKYGFPDFLSQLGSLKEHRMRSLWDRFEADKEIQAFFLEHRIEERVNCITFTELLRRHKLLTVDLLQMDVEGYEWEILRTIDFARIPIRFVNYECTLLHQCKQEAERLMRDSGYNLFDHGLDTFCYKDTDRHLPRRWKAKIWNVALSLATEFGKEPLK